jgi:hypothetical protein
VLVHAAPPRLEVVVRDEEGALLAHGGRLERHAQGPMSLLILDGHTVRLEDRWPNQQDLGRLVILPGGEVGTLLQWWNADDHSEWRWQVEFYNHV